MKITYNFCIVVNGIEHEMILQEIIDPEEQEPENIPTLKEVESVLIIRKLLNETHPTIH